MAGKSLKPLWVILISKKLLQKGALGARALLSLVPLGAAGMLTAWEALCRWLDTFLGHSLVLKSFPAELLGPGFLCKINLSVVGMSQDAACVCKAGDPSQRAVRGGQYNKDLLWSVLGWPTSGRSFSLKVSVLCLKGVFGGDGTDLCFSVQLLLPQ